MNSEQKNISYKEKIQVFSLIIMFGATMVCLCKVFEHYGLVTKINEDINKNYNYKYFDENTDTDFIKRLSSSDCSKAQQQKTIFSFICPYLFFKRSNF